VPRVSVIILNYDGRRWLPACLDALQSQQNAPEFETLVVDNGSTDGSVELVRKHYPAVRVIESGTNLGFAAGNNLGVSHAHAAWLLFLNNDTIADPNWIANLWSARAAHPEFAVLTSRIVHEHEPGR
jgi:GT2 family glycosyltransferase